MHRQSRLFQKYVVSLPELGGYLNAVGTTVQIQSSVRGCQKQQVHSLFLPSADPFHPLHPDSRLVVKRYFICVTVT